MTAIQRRIVLFFLLSYLFTWWGFLLVYVDPSQTWAGTNFALGPLIAAPIVIALTEGRDGLRRWLLRVARFKAPVWVYTAAFFVPLGIAVLSAVLAIAVGEPTAPVPAFGLGDLVLYSAITLIAGPLPEELAFRGFAQFELQQEISPLSASLWVGVGVVIWHLPLFLTREIPWVLAIAIVAISVVYAWLYASGGSLWPLVILHFVVNFFGSAFLQQLLAPAGQATFDAFLTLLVVIWALLIAWQLGRSLKRPGSGNNAG